MSVCVCIGEDGYAEYAERAKTHELKNIDQRVRTGDLSQVLSMCTHIYKYVYLHTFSSCGRAARHDLRQSHAGHVGHDSAEPNMVRSQPFFF